METMIARRVHAIPGEEVVELLDSDSEQGLDVFEVESRQERFGWNAIAMQHGPGPLTRFVLQFHQPLASPQWQAEKQAAFDGLQIVAASIRQATSHVTTQLRTGSDTGDEILKATREYNADIIFVGHKCKSRIKRFLLGSVTNRVMWYAPFSVWRVKRT